MLTYYVKGTGIELVRNELHAQGIKPCWKEVKMVPGAAMPAAHGGPAVRRFRPDRESSRPRHPQRLKKIRSSATWPHPSTRPGVLPARTWAAIPAAGSRAPNGKNPCRSVRVRQAINKWRSTARRSPQQIMDGRWRRPRPAVTCRTACSTAWPMRRKSSTTPPSAKKRMAEAGYPERLRNSTLSSTQRPLYQ